MKYLHTRCCYYCCGNCTEKKDERDALTETHFRPQRVRKEQQQHNTYYDSKKKTKTNHAKSFHLVQNNDDPLLLTK